jgi:hypothetical protein
MVTKILKLKIPPASQLHFEFFLIAFKKQSEFKKGV